MMKRIAAAAVMAILLASPTSVWAQGGKPKDKKEEPAEKSYLIPYAATILGIGIGLAAVCMPSNRKAEIVIEED